MITRISNAILSFVVMQLNIDDEMQDIYRYGIEITISSILNIGLILVLGIALGDLVSSIIYLACIIPIRLYCGGYHAETYLKCNLIFMLCFLLVYYFSSYINTLNDDMIETICEIILLLSFIPIIRFSPVTNPHKELDDNKKKRCRTISIFLYIIYSISAITLVVLHISHGTTMSITISAVSVMVLIEIFLQRRGYHGS